MYANIVQHKYLSLCLESLDMHDTMLLQHSTEPSVGDNSANSSAQRHSSAQRRNSFSSVEEISSTSACPSLTSVKTANMEKTAHKEKTHVDPQNSDASYHPQQDSDDIIQNEGKPPTARGIKEAKSLKKKHVDPTSLRKSSRDKNGQGGKVCSSNTISSQ
jgi:hypothetical protein